MKQAILIACLLAFVTADAQAHKQPKCGTRNKNTVVSTVVLTGPRAHEPSDPVFYVAPIHPTNDLLFLRSADAVEILKKMIEDDEQWNKGSAALSRGLLAEIEKDLPLTDHTDIKKYAFRNAIYRVVIDELVMELLRAGRAGVGYWNYFDPNPLAVSAPIEKLTLYLWEHRGRVYGAQFCSPIGGEVYYYNGEDLI